MACFNFEGYIKFYTILNRDKFTLLASGFDRTELPCLKIYRQ